MSKAGHFSIEEDPVGTFTVYNYMGERCLTLTGGCAMIIVLSFYNMQRIDPVRGDDYMAGVMQGCIHMTMLPPDARPTPKPSSN